MSGAGAVQFSDDLPAKPEKKTQENERTKYLTMKYGQQQIRLIQKRLKVEFWMDEQLNKLYEITDDSDEGYPCDLDLDEILDLDTTEKRRQFLQVTLSDCKLTDLTTAFIEELLSKLDEL